MATSTSGILPSSFTMPVPKVKKDKKSKDMDEKESHPLVKAPPPIQHDFFAPLTGSLERQKRFVMMGDAGTGSDAQKAVALQMLEQYKRQPYATVITLGDNLYKLKKSEDFTTKIAEPYKPLLDENVKFRPILGNHDVKKRDVNEQLTYWGGVPRFYQFTLGSGSSRTDFFALDTTILTPGKNGCFRTKDSTEEQRSDAQRLARQEIAWLKEALARSTAPMKVVLGHYPMFSAGAEATDDFGVLLDVDRYEGQKKLEEELATTLVNGKVDLYVAGHLHHYEKPKNVSGVRYMVSGAAGGLEEDKGRPKETPDLIQKSHFMSFDITPEGLRYQAISDKGEVFDEGLVPKKEQARMPIQRRQRVNCRDLCGTITQGAVSCFKGIGSLLAKCCPSFLTRQPQPPKEKDAAFMV